MFVHPGFDPVAVRLGPIAVHWYGLMYLAGFVGCWWLATRRARKPQFNWPEQRVGDLLFYVALGVILGGRIGYTLFYNFGGFLNDPFVLLRIWEGGMSFHGGLIGVIIAMLLFARRFQLRPFDISDLAAPVIPFGLLTGRIGNFINGELWGKPTDAPWGVVFPHVDSLPRHPSMLYEAALEGLAMMLILHWYGARPRPRMAVTGLFLVLYGLFRIMVEFVRLPDRQIGYLAGTDWMTQGMVLSAPMIVAGGVMIGLGYARAAQEHVLERRA